MVETLADLTGFKYVKTLGEGYFSHVRLYCRLSDGKYVAVKILKKEFVDNNDYKHRFEREITLLEQLSGHPNIVELLASGTIEGQPFYLMPAAETNLEEYIIANNQKLTISNRLDLFDQILTGLSYAHSKSIRHRDLAPKNALIFEVDGRIIVKLSDFGLGKNWSQDSGFTKAMVGNYGQMLYSAPEQHDKLQNATEQSDLFSLGKVLDFVLTGKRPVGIRCTSGFRSVIERATSAEPEDRYSDANDFSAAYEKVKNLMVVEPDDGSLRLPVEFRNADDSIDWIRFHKFATAGKYQKHVYPEYIGIVIDILSDDSNLRAYEKVVADSIADFINMLEQRLSELPAVGWPWSALSEIATIYKNIFFLTNNETIKLTCLKRIWALAYKSDQFRAQKLMSRLLEGGYIPNGIRERFAAEVALSDTIVPRDHLVSDSIPEVIRRAVEAKRLKT